MHRDRRLTARLMLAILLLGLAPRALQAQVPSTIPDGKRAAEVAQVVFGIISYVRWPAPRPELLLCVVGNAKQADALLDTPPSSGGPKVRVQRLPPAATLSAESCDVVYLGILPDAEREKLLTLIVGHPILSISETTISCSVGNMFCLRFRDTQVSFDVNLDSIARSGLRVHPNALQIAKRKAQQP